MPDGWKIGFELLHTPDANSKIVKIDHGVGVIRVTDAGIELADLSSELTGPRSPYFYDSDTRMPLVTRGEALPRLRTA